MFSLVWFSLILFYSNIFKAAFTSFCVYFPFFFLVSDTFLQKNKEEKPKDFNYRKKLNKIWPVLHGKHVKKVVGLMHNIQSKLQTPEHLCIPNSLKIMYVI